MLQEKFEDLNEKISFKQWVSMDRTDLISFSSNKIVPSLYLIILDEFAIFLRFSSLKRLWAFLGLNQ